VIGDLGGIAVVAISITAAPWEYPPSTMRVFGQFAAINWIWPLASLAPAGVLLSKSLLAG
jgi:hypothetical protein